MATLTPREQRQQQLLAKLERELTPVLCQALADPDVIEIMVNPDGRLWLDRLSTGMTATDVVFSEVERESVIGTVAALHDQVVHAGSPRLKAELPIATARFQGMLRPISPPAFVIRKHLAHVLSLDDQIAQGTLTAWQATVLREALSTRRNLLIVGATLSGKTVLANTLLAELLVSAGPTLRLVLIEDTTELHCLAPNVMQLHTGETADLRTLVQDTLRLRPDRIIVGEVRGAEALELLKAWNTGHPGGFTTIHAETAAQAPIRLESLITEAGVQPQPSIIAQTIHLLVVMARSGARHWRVRELVRVTGWDPLSRQYQLQAITAQEVQHDTMVSTDGNLVGAFAPGDGMGDDGRQRTAVGYAAHDGEQRAVGDACARDYDGGDCLCRTGVGVHRPPNWRAARVRGRHGRRVGD